VKRGVLAAAAGGVALVGLAAVAMVPHLAQRSSPGLGTPPGQPTIGGPFDLTDGHAKRLTDADFRGRYMLIYFGYTHCPDACPTMLSDMAAAIDVLPAKDRARLVPIFITVDPERDTPSTIGEYAQAFGPEFVGLTGSPAEITKVEAAYHVYAVRHPLKNGDYAMDHSSILYVMGPDGAFRGVVQDGKPGLMAQQLQTFGI
jgi:protein SCO1/2